MDKDFYQSRIGNETVKQITQGLYQIQTDLDDLRTQIQADKQNKMYDGNFSNCDGDDRSKRRVYDKYSAKDDNVINDLAEQIAVLSNGIRDLKIRNSSEMSDVVGAVKKELENCFSDVTKTVKSFDEMLDDLKKSIVEKIEGEFSAIISKEFLGEEGRFNKLAENVAAGVEKKLELKFADMFMELNRMTDDLQSQNATKEGYNALAENFAVGVDQKLDSKFADMFAELNRVTEDIKLQNAIKEPNEVTAQNVSADIEQKLDNKFADMFMELNRVTEDIKLLNGDQDKYDKVAVDVAAGVEEKLEIKFANMFMELNRVTEDIKLQNATKEPNEVTAQNVSAELEQKLDNKFADMFAELNRVTEDIKLQNATKEPNEVAAQNVSAELEQKLDSKFADMFMELNRVTEDIKLLNGDQDKYDKVAVDVAAGVEEKLEIKFANMFMELNRVTEDIKLQNATKEPNEVSVQNVSAELEQKLDNKFADMFAELNRVTEDIKLQNATKETNEVSVQNVSAELEQKLENKFADMFAELNRVTEDIKLQNAIKEPNEVTAQNVSAELEQKLDNKFADMFAELNRVTEDIKAQSGNQEINDKVAVDVASGVEEKLEVKFSEMFLELNRVIESLKNQNTYEQTQIKLDGEQNSAEMGKQVVDSLDILTLRMDTFEKLLGRNTESLVAERQGTFIVDNQPLVERFDKLAEIVVNNIPQGETPKEDNGIGSGIDNKIDNAIEFAEVKLKINTLTDMLKSRKEVDLRPLFVILNELDDKLADVKYGVNETMSKISAVEVDEAGNIKNEKTQSILSEIPRLVKESVASCLINVDDRDDKATFEKLANQINTLYANDEQKFAEIIKQIAEIKDELSIQENPTQGENSSYKQSEMEETLSSLRGELTNLSKFILEAEEDKTIESNDGAIPNAIKDASNALDGLAREIFVDKRDED